MRSRLRIVGALGLSSLLSLTPALSATPPAAAASRVPPGERGAGDQDRKDDPAPAPDELTERILAEERDTSTRTLGLYRVALSHPQALSARIGTLLSRQPSAFPCTATCDHRGPLFQVEAGSGGAQVSAGYARVIGDRRRDGFFLTDVYVGFGAKGALLRTFGNADRRHRNRTYLGAEGEFTITNVNFTVGVFRRVSDGPARDRWLTLLGVGWGF